MYTDARLVTALERMLREIEPPPVPYAQIRERIAQRQRPRSHWSLYAAAGAAAAAMFVLSLPAVAPGLTQSIEAQIEAVLHWTPPPPAPSSVESAMRSHIGDLAAAQARVDFTIVPPTGLPKDVISERVATTPTGVYSKITDSWSVGSPCVWFVYRRSDGRSFMLLADRFDSRTGPPSRYIFEDRGERDGREVLVRHERYVWRNGDQVMSAVADEGISAPAIQAIRSAMGGIVEKVVWPPQSGTIEKQYRMP
jgi:hypothetical protein